MKAAKMLGIMLGILIIVHVAEAAEETQKGTGLEEKTSMGLTIRQA